MSAGDSDWLRRHGISPVSLEKTMRCGWRVSAVLSAIALTVGADRAYCAADYAREARLAQEIVPAIVVGDAVYLTTARQPRVLALYTDAASPAIAKAAVIVVHGVGVHPDWALINGLRTGLAEAGMSTLSAQMPVLSADAPREQYETLLPESNDRLAAAVAYLRERGAERIAIVSHSMGASMADAYLSSSSAAKLAAWVPIGMMKAFGSRPDMPVLDIIAERESARQRSRATLARNRCSSPEPITTWITGKRSWWRRSCHSSPAHSRASADRLQGAMRCSAQPIVDRDPIGTVGRRLDPDFVGAARVEGAQVGVKLLSVSLAFSRCVDPGA
jgi:hypothetical protein